MHVTGEVNEITRIASQLERFYDGTSWLGPSLKTILSDVTEGQARAREIPGAHTIWDLVLHIRAWLRIARERLSATAERDADPAEDWPPMTSSWQDALSSLEAEVRSLGNAVREFPETRLDEKAPAREEQTFYQLLHGVIQHSAYHAGQISLLKKLV